MNLHKKYLDGSYEPVAPAPTINSGEANRYAASAPAFDACANLKERLISSKYPNPDMLTHVKAAIERMDNCPESSIEEWAAELSRDLGAHRD